MLTSLPHLLYTLSYWHHYPLHNGIPVGATDPDSWLRLTLVRDWLSGGGWYNHLVASTNVPYGGISSPWTRPLDVVIAALAYMQPESVDINLRLMRTSLLLPWLWMTLLTCGIYRIVALTSPPRASYLMASLLVACTPVIWNYFQLGNADHHAPLAVLFIWAMAAILQEKPSRAAILCSGVLLGLQLWISVEALILIAAIYTWYGMQWLRGKPQHAAPLAMLTSVTAITSLIALLAERPYSAWLTPIYDSISIVHVAALIAAALVAWALRCAPAAVIAYLRWRMVWAGLACGSALGVIYRIYPLLFAGPMVGTDPFIITHFMPNISEAAALYQAPTTLLLANIILPVAALMLCISAIIRPRDALYSRLDAEKLLFFVLVTFALYVMQQRWSYYLLPLAVAVVAPALGALFAPDHAGLRTTWPARWLSGLPETVQAGRRLPILIALGGLPLLLTISGDFSDFIARYTASVGSSAAVTERLLNQKRTACYNVARQLLYSGRFDRLIGGTPTAILAPTDLGAEIMFWSGQRIVASNYHREGSGIRYVWEANDLTDAASLRYHLARRSVRAMLLCPTVRPAKDSLMQRLLDGETPPAWLRVISYDAPAASDNAADHVISMPLILGLVD